MMETLATSGSEHERALRTARDRFVALAFCWADLVLEVGQDRRVIFAAGAADRLVGRSAKNLKGHPLLNLVKPSDQDIVNGMLTAAEHHGRIDNVPVWFVGEAGAGVPLIMAGYCVPDMGDHFFLAFRLDPAALVGDAQGVAPRDGQSGLHGPENFSDVASKALSGQGDRRLTVLDMPDMATLRDKLDSETNDHLQRTIGACLKAHSVGGDAAGRISEEKYGLVHGPELNLPQLQAQIAAYAKQADPTGEGVEVRSATVEPGETVMSGADLATGVLFMMNNLRRSQGEAFTLESLTLNLSDLVGEATKSVAAFKAMVDNDTFEMAFHPIVEVATGKVHHYEVLARFDAIGNAGSPFKDITLAEETGMIRAFDMAMTKKAINWLMVYGDGGKHCLAVNLSGHSISDAAFVEELHGVLDQYRWAANSLMFEITESSEIQNLEMVNAVLQGLRVKGFRICLDDFGAGAANFQYLSTLEVDVVKLDGPALKQAQVGPRGKAFIRALASLCRDMNTEIVAEMVDDQTSLAFVRQCGVLFVQGYIYGEPSKNIADFANMQKGRTGWGKGG